MAAWQPNCVMVAGQEDCLKVARQLGNRGGFFDGDLEGGRIV